MNSKREEPICQIGKTNIFGVGDRKSYSFLEEVVSRKSEIAWHRGEAVLLLSFIR